MRSNAVNLSGREVSCGVEKAVVDADWLWKDPNDRSPPPVDGVAVADDDDDDDDDDEDVRSGILGDGARESPAAPDPTPVVAADRGVARNEFGAAELKRDEGVLLTFAVGMGDPSAEYVVLARGDGDATDPWDGESKLGVSGVRRYESRSVVPLPLVEGVPATRRKEYGSPDLAWYESLVLAESARDRMVGGADGKEDAPVVGAGLLKAVLRPADGVGEAAPMAGAGLLTAVLPADWREETAPRAGAELPAVLRPESENAAAVNCVAGDPTGTTGTEEETADVAANAGVPENGDNEAVDVGMDVTVGIGAALGEPLRVRLSRSPSLSLDKSPRAAVTRSVSRDAEDESAPPLSSGNEARMQR
jgi:hypothetical protein